MTGVGRGEPGAQVRQGNDSPSAEFGMGRWKKLLWVTVLAMALG
jgi:hypothetical protein